MGHSLGGNFTLFVLEQEILNNINYFKNYVAASPYLGYCNDALIKQFQNITVSDSGKQINLILSIGGNEDEEAEYTNKFNSFVQLLSTSNFKTIKLIHEFFPLFGHMETAVPTFTKAIKEIK
jgi:predicted alpha/beta superfamily hydrolase